MFVVFARRLKVKICKLKWIGDKKCARKKSLNEMMVEILLRRLYIYSFLLRILCLDVNRRSSGPRTKTKTSLTASWRHLRRGGVLALRSGSSFVWRCVFSTIKVLLPELSCSLPLRIFNQLLPRIIGASIYIQIYY